MLRHLITDARTHCDSGARSGSVGFFLGADCAFAARYRNGITKARNLRISAEQWAPAPESVESISQSREGEELAPELCVRNLDDSCGDCVYKDQCSDYVPDDDDEEEEEE